MELTRDRAGQPWRARQREILSRIVRETEPPTDSLPRITDPERSERDDSYDARVGEVLDLAGSIGAILMASGTPATATMDQVTAIAAAYGIERCEVDVINTTIHVAAYRGPTIAPGQHAAHRAIPVDGLQPTGGRRPLDRAYPRGPGVSVASPRRA